MWLINKYKVVSVFFLLLVLASCSGPSTNLLFEQNMSKQKPKPAKMGGVVVSDKVEVIKDDNLGKYEDPGMYGESQSFMVDLNSRVPVYIVTGRFNSLSSVYGQLFCDSLNNDFINNKYLCIIQSQQDIELASKFLRKDDLSVDPEAGYVADFLITRVDYLLEKQKFNSGPLKDFPTLDAVMFLNGSYLFLWGDDTYQSVELSHFVTKFSEKHPNVNVKIAVANSLAKTLVTKVILANKWAANFEFITLDEDNLNHKSKNYNIIAYAGPSIDKNLLSYIETYNNTFVPLALSENVIFNVQKSNPEISDANIAKYFSSDHLINIIKLISNLKSMDDKQSLDLTKYDNQNCKSNNAKLPFISGVKVAADYDKYIFGKSKFNFNVKSIDEILSLDKVININNVKVSGIGIRNVLVASRATNPMIVFSLLSAILSKHDLIRINFATPDMRGYSLNNLITGNLYDNQVIYHYGVINFMNYATNYSNNRLWDKEAEVVSIINKFLDAKNAPPFYGPNIPNTSQINAINNESHKRIIINQQEKVLENFKSIIDTIKEEMKNTTVTNDTKQAKSEDSKTTTSEASKAGVENEDTSEASVDNEKSKEASNDNEDININILDISLPENI